jgi:hypothetical protein
MSGHRTMTISGRTTLVLSEEGPKIAVPSDASDVVGEAVGLQAEMVVIPLARLSPAFFDLRSGLAGEVTQKFVNYRIRLVFLGAVDAEMEASKAFRDYVREANRSRHISFAKTIEEMETLP